MNTIVEQLKQALLNNTGKYVEGDTIADVLASYNAHFINATAEKLPASCISWAPGETTNKAKANQAAVKVEQKGRAIIVKGKLNDLQSFASANQEQGTAKWLCVVFDTHEDAITDVTCNGSAMTADDVTEAASVGQGAGKFVLWIKAEVVSITPKSVALATASKPAATYTVSFVNE